MAKRNFDRMSRKLNAHRAATERGDKQRHFGDVVQLGQLKKRKRRHRQEQRRETLDEFKARGGQAQVIKNSSWKKPEAPEPIPWKELF